MRPVPLRRPVILLAALCALAVLPAMAAERRHFGARPPGEDSPPLSKAVLVGDTLYLSGELGLLPGRRVPETAEREATLLLQNVKATLAGAGMTMDDLVSVQVFCSDVAHFDAWNRVYRAYFTKEYPARAFVGSGPLLFGARFEMQGVAVRRSVAPPPRAATEAGVVSHAPGVTANADLDAIYARFAAAYAAGDADAAADVYTEDVSYMPPDSPVVAGRAEARKGFDRFFGSLRAAGRKAALSFEVLGRGVTGHLGFDVGVFTLKTSGDGAGPSEMRGKFVVVARRDPDGAWRWRVDAYSGLAPPAAP